MPGAWLGLSSRKPTTWRARWDLAWIWLCNSLPTGPAPTISTLRWPPIWRRCKRKRLRANGTPDQHRKVSGQDEGKKEQARDFAKGEIERTRQGNGGQQGAKRQADKLVDAAQVAATVVNGKEQQDGSPFGGKDQEYLPGGRDQLGVVSRKRQESQVRAQAGGKLQRGAYQQPIQEQREDGEID